MQMKVFFMFTTTYQQLYVTYIDDMHVSTYILVYILVYVKVFRLICRVHGINAYCPASGQK